MAATETGKNHYICVSIHESSSDAQGYSTLYEERITLIVANSKEEAAHKAQLAVARATHTYKNTEEATITWTCRRIVDVADMVDSEFKDGAEIYGRYFRDIDSYEQFEPHLKGRVEPNPS